MATVTIKGWETGFRKISMTKLIQDYCNMPLKESKECVDRIMEGEPIGLIITDSRVDNFVREATRIGAKI